MKREKVTQERAVLVQNSKLWRLREGEGGKGEREEGERTGRGANKRERER